MHDMDTTHRAFSCKTEKAVERAADAREQEVKAEYQKQKEAEQCGISYSLPPKKRKDDFAAFVNDVWFPLHVRSGKCVSVCSNERCST